MSVGLFARGMAASYRAGRQHIRALAKNISREAPAVCPADNQPVHDGARANLSAMKNKTTTLPASPLAPSQNREVSSSTVPKPTTGTVNFNQP